MIDEFPEGFFDRLSGGIVVSEKIKISPYAIDDNLIIAGCYTESPFVKQVTLYFGSFCKLYEGANREEVKGQIRRVLRHEMRHHFECEAGEHSSRSLEAEDTRKIQEYLNHNQEASAG